MYPTVVILLVETHRSMTDVCEISPSNASKLVASEARPATTTDNQPQYRRSFGLQSQVGRGHGLEEIILKVKESLPDGTSG